MTLALAFVCAASAVHDHALQPAHNAAAQSAHNAAAQPTLTPLPFDVAINTADMSAAAVTRAIKKGFELGITAVDFHLGTTANGMREREGVAQAVKDIGREKLTLITKLDKPPATMTDAAAARELAKQTLDDEFAALGVDSVDMLLLKDSASCPVMLAQWQVLEEALAAGKARMLGTYNYCEFSLACLLGNATTPPAANFLMRHVGMGKDATGIIAFGLGHGVQTSAYGTVGEPVALTQLLSHPLVHFIADSHGVSVGAVALQWNVQSGYPVTNRITADYAALTNEPNGTAYCTDGCIASLKDMAALKEWSLTPREMSQLDGLDLGLNFSQSPTYYSSTGCPYAYGVSTYPTVSACASYLPKFAATWC